MHFDSAATRRTYSDRTVDDSWNEWCVAHLAPAGKDVVDIGCGGGIYALGFAALGARSVVGVDRSRQYLDESTEAARGLENVSFHEADASRTALPDACADIVFERAVIHHLEDAQKRENAVEALRILRPGGVLCAQDRTLADIQTAHPHLWIRATLFEVFPRLLDLESARRPSKDGYSGMLREVGFANVETLPYQEIRKRYGSFAQLRDEILTRKGKSILFELNDDELRRYCDRLEEKSASHPLIECDLWTVWLARR